MLTDPFVSRRHCSVAPTAQGFAITDLGSSNGTVIDGVAVGKVVAPPGVALRIGKTLIQLMPADEVRRHPTVDERSTSAALYGGSRSRCARCSRSSSARASRARPVLFLGESGTGKELMARGVHDASPRKDGPFVVFDCGASTETLIESDLFGHTKGAFTGAAGDRVGAFAAAHGGTLFLDEIGDLPVGLQPKLLRMLEAGEVIPLGGRKSEQYDVRIVAATHRDVFGEVARGGFRGDLYYRLAVVEVHVPPLRQRTGDLARLIQMFLEQRGRAEARGAGRRRGPRAARALSLAGQRARASQRDHARRRARRSRRRLSVAAVRAAADRRRARARSRSSADRPFHEAKDEIVDRFEREYLTDLVQRAGGNLSQAARIAGLERKFLYKLLERAGLRGDRQTREKTSAAARSRDARPRHANALASGRSAAAASL